MDKKDLKDEKLLYNVRETAAVLGVNVHLVYELINRKLLPALRLGSLKVRKSTLIDFVERYEGMDLSDLDNIKRIATEYELVKLRSVWNHHGVERLTLFY